MTAGAPGSRPSPPRPWMCAVTLMPTAGALRRPLYKLYNSGGQVWGSPWPAAPKTSLGSAIAHHIPAAHHPPAGSPCLFLRGPPALRVRGPASHSSRGGVKNRGPGGNELAGKKESGVGAPWTTGGCHGEDTLHGDQLPSLSRDRSLCCWAGGAWDPLDGWVLRSPGWWQWA